MLEDCSREVFLLLLLFCWVFFYVPTLAWNKMSCPCYLEIKEQKHENLGERKKMKTTHSDTRKNKQKTTRPQALSSFSERLMSVPEDPKLK